MTFHHWTAVNISGELQAPVFYTLDCLLTTLYLFFSSLLFLPSGSREAGIGCTVSPGTTKAIDSNRTEILKLLMTCFSEPLYLTPEGKRVGR